ncbi:MAG: DJ-1/PfpI family protein [Leptospira sp.]|nr:DJ-1/PfpI family protein [Leptospira sp.]
MKQQNNYCRSFFPFRTGQSIPFMLMLFVMITHCAQISYFQKLDPLEMEPQQNVKYSIDHNKLSKTIVILADTEGTEITDIIVPYSLLKMAGFNVYIVSNKKGPVLLWKGMVVLPHFSVEDFPFSFDAVVVPNVFHPNDKSFEKFLKNSKNPILSVCEGAKVIVHSQNFLEHKITTHASSLDQLEKEFPNHKWTRQQKFVVDRNLISTAGVSSSIEGTLVLISKLANARVLESVKQKINYPHAEIRSEYLGEKVSLLDQLTIIWKVAFDDDPSYSLLLKPGVNEMDVALTLDIWARTFPSSITAISKGYILSENGLLLAGLKQEPTGTTSLCIEDCQTMNQILDSKYTMDENLASVAKAFGKRFESVVRRLMDY